jgi:hypothetical protein
MANLKRNLVKQFGNAANGTELNGLATSQQGSLATGADRGAAVAQRLSGEKNEKINEIERTRVRSPPPGQKKLSDRMSGWENIAQRPAKLAQNVAQRQNFCPIFILIYTYFRSRNSEIRPIWSPCCSQIAHRTKLVSSVTRLCEFSPVGRVFTFGSFFNYKKGEKLLCFVSH